MSNFVIDQKAIGGRIRDLRTKKHKSQSYYADLFYISPSYLALIEAGKRIPNLEVLVQIAKVCEVTLDYLVFGDNPIPDNIQNEFTRLCSLYSAKDMEKALKLTEFYLQLANTD